VAVLGHEIWTQRFGADERVLGRTVRLNARTVTIVGVMPQVFAEGLNAQLWTPLALTAEERLEKSKGFLVVYGRLRTGVSAGPAAREAGLVGAQLEDRAAFKDRVGARVETLYASLVGSLRQRLFILLGAVMLVFLIACGNVANLLLARGASRVREMAVRSAIGAGRGRLVAQLLAESTVMGVLGGVAGLVFAVWGIKLIVLLSPDVPRLEQARLDVPTVAFAMALSLVGAWSSAWCPRTEWRASTCSPR
jgi:ABC-type antimicrobial peptide transport system permease subunit